MKIHYRFTKRVRKKARPPKRKTRSIQLAVQKKKKKLSFARYKNKQQYIKQE